jgi:hypothetical protein
MKGSAPNSPLTGSQAWRKKNPKPNFEIESWERAISSNKISATIAKITRAHAIIRPEKALSMPAELPRDCRNFRIGEISVAGFAVPGTMPDAGSIVWLEPAALATRTS